MHLAAPCRMPLAQEPAAKVISEERIAEIHKEADEAFVVLDSFKAGALRCITSAPAHAHCVFAWRVFASSCSILRAVRTDSQLRAQSSPHGPPPVRAQLSSNPVVPEEAEHQGHGQARCISSSLRPLPTIIL